MNISETSRPIAIKFYLKQHWGGGKAALGFWPDRIGTLVSMATDSSHRVIIGKNGVITFSRMLLIRFFSYLQVTITWMRAWMSSKFGRIRPRTTELAALERMKEIPLTYNRENDVITFSPLFLIGSFSYLQITRTCIRA